MRDIVTMMGSVAIWWCCSISISIVLTSIVADAYPMILEIPEETERVRIRRVVHIVDATF